MTLSPQEIAESLYVTAAETLGRTPDEVRESARRGGEIDSLQGIELIMALEQQYGIEIEDDALSSRLCRSIPRIAALVGRKASGKVQTGGSASG